MTKEDFIKDLERRIIILDGGLGTMIQSYTLNEWDFRGQLFTHHTEPLIGNNDLLCLTRPDVIKAIHLRYLEAGADIISTNSFNANAISMADYGLEKYVSKMNFAAAQTARQAVNEFKRQYPFRKVYIAGSMGPTNKTASMSPDISDPAFRNITYTQLYAAYREQAAALISGGVDILLFETVFDTLNAKAGLEAAADLIKERKVDLPIMLSVTLSGQDGRTLSGQTLEAFVSSVEHLPITSIGLNCSFGASDMLPWLRELSRFAPWYISAHPNAGLPNELGSYDESPESMAVNLRPFVTEGLVNILGGCCGTTPEHISRYPMLVADQPIHRCPQKRTMLHLSGLEALECRPNMNFINIGERCNVAGSRRFLRLIQEGEYEDAVSIALKQVEDGAQIVDINMDDGMIDAVKEMKHFINLIAAEPEIARVPVMIDSSKWEVVEEALKCLSGRSIVNSISLKEGEKRFLSQALRINQLGGVAMVMAFDEKGQADTFERKTEICERAYHLLTDAGIPPYNIIFDPGVLAIATGMEEHNSYGRAFIESVAWIKKHLPGALVSGGISNVSFAFRGNNYLREAIHAVFLYHAIAAGLDMGIVNPATTVFYTDIEPTLRLLIEDVVLNRRANAADELIAFAEKQLAVKNKEPEEKTKAWRLTSLEERLEYALMKGTADYLEQDLAEALQTYPQAVDIIDGPLMSGMKKVGVLFGEGKMFLPQVVKTARTMKKAVSILQPAIEVGQDSEMGKSGKILVATVKGDVHDIGKNIAAIILSCNNYDVVDLGVMVPADEIVRRAQEEKPDMIGLSGLITPSLDEMVNVVKALNRAKLKIPVLVSGATTSQLHTALKIAPHYDGLVVHAVDASQNPLIASQLLHPEKGPVYKIKVRREYRKLCASVGSAPIEMVSLSEARSHPFQTDWGNYKPVRPAIRGPKVIKNIPIDEVVEYINWNYFFTAWSIPLRYAKTILHLHHGKIDEQSLESMEAEEREKIKEGLAFMRDADQILQYLIRNKVKFCKAIYGIFPAVSEGDSIRIGKETLPMLRQQRRNEEGIYRSLADYVMPLALKKTDYVGAFVVTGADEADKLRRHFESKADIYHAIIFQSLTDRLAEATAEWLHAKVRRQFWGYAADETLSINEMFKARYAGIRPAVGYPSLPDQKLNESLDRLLDFSRIGIDLTSNGAMSPSSSISGLYLAHPEAKYFLAGDIDKEQLTQYATMRGMKVPEMQKILGKHITW